MKKIRYYLVILCVALAAFSNNVTATTVIITHQSEQAGVFINRLTEIKEMDKSGLTGVDKKQLRAEVLSIQKQLQQIDGGIYLSAGAIIIILLILILIF